MCINKINEVDLLKIDIEGAELQLFLSTSDDVFSSIKQISIEFHDFMDLYPSEEVKKIINRFKSGFYIIKFSRYYYYDVLFINKLYCNLFQYVTIKHFIKYIKIFQRKLASLMKIKAM